MTLFSDINYFAIFVSTIAYYIIGFVWYALLFEKIWGKETGVPVPPKPNIWALVGQFISTLLYTFGIAIVLKLYGTYDLTAGIHVSAIITLFFVIPINSGNLFFTGKKKLFLLDVCERAVGSLVIGIILGVWK